MHDLNDLYYFVKVAEHGGFAPAGRALGIPKSKLSRRIAQLEHGLGVRLIQRSTRQFSVTDVGQTFLRHAQGMLEQAEAAMQAVAVVHETPRGIIRMSCPETLLDYRVGQVVAQLMADYPDVEVHLDATGRRIDPVAEGVDIAIRVRPPPLEDSDLILKVLGESCQNLVASPALLNQLGVPQSPEALSGYPSMDLGLPQNQHLWDLYGPEDAHVAIHHQPRLVTRSMRTLLDAAMNGVGIVQLPRLMTEQALLEGRLSVVLQAWQPKPEVIHLVYPSRHGQTPAVRRMIERLAQAFAEKRQH